MPFSVTTSTFRPRSSSRSRTSAAWSSRLRSGSKSTSRSMSLLSSASPRATEPNTRMLCAPCLEAIRRIWSRFSSIKSLGVITESFEILPQEGYRRAQWSDVLRLFHDQLFGGNIVTNQQGFIAVHLKCECLVSIALLKGRILLEDNRGGQVERPNIETSVRRVYYLAHLPLHGPHEIRKLLPRGGVFELGVGARANLSDLPVIVEVVKFGHGLV